MTVGTEIIAILGMVNATLLTGLVTFQWKIWGMVNKLKDEHVEKREAISKEIAAKRSVSDCVHEQANCFGRFDRKIQELYREGERLCKEDEDLWSAMHGHSHSGLPPDSKVTR